MLCSSWGLSRSLDPARPGSACAAGPSGQLLFPSLLCQPAVPELSAPLSPAFMSLQTAGIQSAPPTQTQDPTLSGSASPLCPTLGEPHFLIIFLNKKSESDYDVEALLLRGEGRRGEEGGAGKGWGWGGLGAAVKGTHPLREDFVSHLPPLGTVHFLKKKPGYHGDRSGSKEATC